MSEFYVVEKAGIPAVWQTDAAHIGGLLRRKAGFKIAAAEPSGTRRDALAVLRQLFPGHRPVKAQAQ